MTGAHILSLKICQGHLGFILIQGDFVIWLFVFMIADVIFQNFIYN